MLVFRVTLDPDDIQNVRGRSVRGRAGPLELPQLRLALLPFCLISAGGIIHEPMAHRGPCDRHNLPAIRPRISE